jgi:hypothetical protein
MIRRAWTVTLISTDVSAFSPYLRSLGQNTLRKHKNTGCLCVWYANIADNLSSEGKLLKSVCACADNFTDVAVPPPPVSSTLPFYHNSSARSPVSVTSSLPVILLGCFAVTGFTLVRHWPSTHPQGICLFLSSPPRPARQGWTYQQLRYCRNGSRGPRRTQGSTAGNINLCQCGDTIVGMLDSDVLFEVLKNLWES